MTLSVYPTPQLQEAFFERFHNHGRRSGANGTAAQVGARHHEHGDRLQLPRIRWRRSLNGE